MNVFTMPFFGADSGPWRKMSRARPATSAITTSSGCTCPSHRESAWGNRKPGRKGLLWRLLERRLLAGDVGIFVEHIYKCFVPLLSYASDVGQSLGAGVKLLGPSFPSPTATLDRKRTTKRRRHVW